MAICPSPNGHLQAVGRDARGRKQYRYHPRYREGARSGEVRLNACLLGDGALAIIRRQVEKDLHRPGLPKDKVLFATVVRLLETTFIRVGNDEYARDNNSFGSTTLKNRHVEIEGVLAAFPFSRARKGLEAHRRTYGPPPGRYRETVPGFAGLRAIRIHRRGWQGLFCRIGRREPVHLCRFTSRRFTAKDFRTWRRPLYSRIRG